MLDTDEYELFGVFSYDITGAYIFSLDDHKNKSNPIFFFLFSQPSEILSRKNKTKQ